jgi:hypothetical protein
MGMASERRKLTIASRNLFGALVLGIWILFVICNLELGIFLFLKTQVYLAKLSDFFN